MKLLKGSHYLTFTLLAILLFGCKKSSTDVAPGTEAVPEIYKKIYGASSITSDGTYVIIKTTGLPDHKSIYFSPTNSLYQDYSGTTFGGYTFKKNPNIIAVYNYTFKIPINPVVAANHTATGLGAIGVSLNGVPFYNQYAGPNQPLTNEFMSFDQYWGHPTANGNYHYHV